ncbi:hypothetical protein CHS0354_029430 [Potamilus streckersoni]|uniref:Uncharacterized protein n=1 Tax=Potamilus streckersoni TaxID=2493646 RepID=A0AAE0W0T5_9BIVA|nr:hypothetical protein CHS0354_029430 [Potamilus streckersoni]
MGEDEEIKERRRKRKQSIEDRIAMERDQRIEKRNRETANRIRKMNNVAARLLKEEIGILDRTFNKQVRLLKLETQHIQQELEEIGPESSGIVTLPIISTSNRNLVSSSSSLVITESRPATSGDVEEQLSCRFNAIQGGEACKHFPCYLPRTYHSLSILPKRPQTYSMLSNYRQLLRECKKNRPPTSKSILDSYNTETEESYSPRTARLTVKDRERGLRQLVKEMKEKNEKTRPRDWAINYGDPVPRRLLLKPVIPVSDQS